MTGTQAQSTVDPDASLPEDMPPADGGEEPPDESIEEVTYVAIEGVKPEDFDETEAERLEVSIINTLLTQLGKPITDVRVIGEDVAVAEMELTDD